MGENIYNLEDRTLEYSKRILKMTRALPTNNTNLYYNDQCIRSGSSTGANYREANDALGKKDFLHRLRISRKECKESIYWLELIIENNPNMKNRIIPLLNEGIEIRNILSSIIIKTENKNKQNKIDN